MTDILTCYVAGKAQASLNHSNNGCIAFYCRESHETSDGMEPFVHVVMQMCAVIARQNVHRKLFYENEQNISKYLYTTKDYCYQYFTACVRNKNLDDPCGSYFVPDPYLERKRSAP